MLHLREAGANWRTVLDFLAEVEQAGSAHARAPVIVLDPLVSGVHRARLFLFRNSVVLEVDDVLAEEGINLAQLRMYDLEFFRNIDEVLLSHAIDEVFVQALLERRDASGLVISPVEGDVACGTASRLVPGAPAQIQIWLTDLVKFGRRLVRSVTLGARRRDIARAVRRAHVQVNYLLRHTIELVGQVNHVAGESIQVPVFID